MLKIFYITFVEGEYFKRNERSRELCPFSSMFALLALNNVAFYKLPREENYYISHKNDMCKTSLAAL